MATKAKVAGKGAFYKRMRKDKPGINDEAIRALWVEKLAKKKALDAANKK